MESDELVEVYTVKTSTEAEIVRGALEAEGIRAFVDGGGQAGLSGIFDIHVLVAQDDETRARELLADYEQAKLDDDDDELTLDEEATPLEEETDE